jgi:hypothetical protein
LNWSRWIFLSLENFSFCNIYNIFRMNRFKTMSSWVWINNNNNIQMFNEIVKNNHFFIYSIIKYVQLHLFIIRQVRKRHNIFWFIVSFSFMYETCQLNYIKFLRNYSMKNHSSYNSSIDVIIDTTFNVINFNEFTFTISDVKKIIKICDYK